MDHIFLRSFVWSRDSSYFMDKFYIYSSVHHNSRLKKSNKMQLYADIYLLLNYCTCFGRPSRPSSGVHKTVVAASGTDHTIWEASKMLHTVASCWISSTQNYDARNYKYKNLIFSQQIFVKCSIIKFHENPSSGSRVVSCGRTDRQA